MEKVLKNWNAEGHTTVPESKPKVPSVKKTPETLLVITVVKGSMTLKNLESSYSEEEMLKLTRRKNYD